MEIRIVCPHCLRVSQQPKSATLGLPHSLLFRCTHCLEVQCVPVVTRPGASGTDRSAPSS